MTIRHLFTVRKTSCAAQLASTQHLRKGSALTIREDEIKIADAVSRRSALSNSAESPGAGLALCWPDALDLAVVAVVVKLGERQI